MGEKASYQTRESRDGDRLDGDDALKLVSDGGVVTIDEIENRRLRRKIDLMLMPEISLVRDNYQWLGSIFYFGYLGFEYPAAWLLQRLPIAKFSGAMIIAWGIVGACFASVGNFGGAVTIRLFLGIFEAAVSPGWVLITSQWYSKREQATRTAWWFSFNGWSMIFGGLVAYGFARGSQNHGFTFSPWRIIFLFTGLLTIVVGIIFLVVVPDSQLNTWWLNKEDRVLAVERVRANQQGIGNKHFKLYQVREALTDLKTWMFCLLAIAGNIPNGGLTNFSNLVLISLGLDPTGSLLYGCITGAIQISVCMIWAYTTVATDQRILCAFFWMLVALVGSIVLVAVPSTNPRGRLAGFYLAQTFFIGTVLVASMIATNVAGYTKKTTVAAMFFICYCTGNIIGPQTFRPEDRPRFIPAEIAIMVCYAICLVDLAALYLYLSWENRRNAKKRADSSYRKVLNQEFLDLTDRENPEFVYVL